MNLVNQALCNSEEFRPPYYILKQFSITILMITFIYIYILSYSRYEAYSKFELGWVGCMILFLWFLYAQPPVAAGLKTAFAWHKAQDFYWSSHEFCMRGQPSFPTVCSLTAHSKETKEVCLVTHHISPSVWTLFIRAGRKTIWTSDTVQTLLGLSQDSAGVFKSVFIIKS